MDIATKIASLEVLQAAMIPVDLPSSRDAVYNFKLVVRKLDTEAAQRELIGEGTSVELAIADAVSQLCVRPIQIVNSAQREQKDGCLQCLVIVNDTKNDASTSAIQQNSQRSGAGRYVARSSHFAMAIATIRAVNHAGLLKSEFRSNNQKYLRQSSHEIIEELTEVLALGSLAEQKRLEADSVVLDHLNRVASAAVVTATNAARPDSILGLFDTSTWLYDSQGRKRDAFTDTQLWFAWYPGLNQPDRTVDAVIQSMPAAPASAIPWIVRVFENPESWIRFRGAVDLEDHDILHVLLGRGLQDQDEAFVLGFAMGTAKKIRWWEYHFFQFVIARLYPEPYRIPKFLHPAFRLGVQCGRETGKRNLFKGSLKHLRSLTIDAARREAGIDVEVLRSFYRLEQAAIPITIASLRL